MYLGRGKQGIPLPFFPPLSVRSSQSLKVIWSIGKGSEIFRKNSHLFDFHQKHIMYKVLHENFSPEMCLVYEEFEVET